MFLRQSHQRIMHTYVGVASCTWADGLFYLAEAEKNGKLSLLCSNWNHTFVSCKQSTYHSRCIESAKHPYTPSELRPIIIKTAPGTMPKPVAAVAGNQRFPLQGMASEQQEDPLGGLHAMVDYNPGYCLNTQIHSIRHVSKVRLLPIAPPSFCAIPRLI